jgi:F-type H+-transporting ATPase subunit b
MELDATTFVLEVVNFLVLLWLLNRFLYRPVRAALDSRAQAAARDAQAIAQQREALDARSTELDRRAQDLAAQRGAAERTLAAQMAAERDRALAALAREIEDERDKARARLAQDLQAARRQGEHQQRERAAAFVTDYLRRLASPAVEAAVMELFLAELAAQPAQVRAALVEGWADRHESFPAIDVCTAYAPTDSLRERVDAQVGALVGEMARTAWHVDPTLIAGICVHLPGHQLEASLRRSVDAFAAEAT